MIAMLALGFVPGLVVGAILGVVVGVAAAPVVLMVVARSEWRRASLGARSTAPRIGYAPAAPRGDRAAS